MEHAHHYSVTIQWTGNKGIGTRDYRSYERSHLISADKKPEIPGSSDPIFRGDPARYNPEDLLVASLSACHMLSYLHLCAINGVVVTDYTDQASGTMQEEADGGGRFREVILHPVVTVAAESMIQKAQELHHKAHDVCFIANSCNFPVHQEPISRVAAAKGG